MPPIDEDDKRYRSMKLCQLICDRQIDSEIGFEIRKLLEEGVLIDFQDQNRSKKTAIHLAVEKCDVICVKFLLRFKPNLEVKDEDGKTPVELAESNDDKIILNALLNSTVDVVNESFVEVIDFKNLTPQKVEAIKSRASFKVLKLTNCPSADHVWMKLKDQGYVTALNESSHFFFIAIETKKKKIRNNHELMNKVLNSRRPMIVQLTPSDRRKPKVYFKDDKLKNFEEITDTTQINQEELDAAVQSGEECNFKLLFGGLRSNLFGHITGDLLETKLNTNDSRIEAVNQFAKSNALCHRFFKLFEKNQPRIERIVATLSFKGDQSLLALLDLPFELNDEKVKLTEYQQDILTVVDSSGCNLLMMAVEQKNLDAVRLLLRCGSDFNHSDNYENRASDICWQMKACDCLAELIESGSPYPKKFCLEKLQQSLEVHGRINAMIKAINSLHANIEKGAVEDVEEFIASHPHIKHAFNTDNKCALTLALQSNQVEIHSLLMSKGFEPGADDEYYEVLVKFEFKNEIRNSHRKYFKEAFDEPHLKRLLKMFRLSFGSKDRAKCSTIIRRMFDELNEIDGLIPILQICSLSDKLRIVFDFNCDSVADMDPTKGSSTLGIVYPIGGFVYVGAKNHEKGFFKVIGTLIHELTHYAMKLTYENSCKPYDDDDVANENRFEEITTETKKICDENPSTDEIVSTVFSLYKQSVWHQELIVRVPQLLAHYRTNPQALKAAERNTPELFHFYREQTLKDVERQSNVLLKKYSIGKINNQTGMAQKSKNLNVKFETDELVLKPSSVNIITSNAPQLTLAMLEQVDCDGSHIFVSLEQVALGNILDKIAKVNAMESSTTLIVDCIGMVQKYPESVRKLMKSIKTIALVMTEAESSSMKEICPEVKFKTLTHKWGELTESSKVHLLDRNVIFQGVEMKLNELVEPSSEAMNFFPLGELVDLKEFRIASELHQTLHKIYIPRKFIRKGQDRSTRAAENAMSFEELLRIESRMGAMIISDEAGSGKSVALFEIAKSLHVTHSDRWVEFVDLKRHIEAYKSVEDREKIESFEDFIVQNILMTEPEFDRELFKEMFQAGKTLVLLDGFDEISPNYKVLLLNVLKLFKPRSGNQLFIATRSHLEADLEGALGKFVFKLEEFSEESQKSFMRKYWQSVEFEMSHEKFEVLSSRLLQRFSEISTSNIVGLPLLMSLTVKIFEDPIKENLLHKVDTLGIASVFRQFVEKYFLRWTNNENEISRNEAVKFQMAGGVLEVHHKIAINHFFGEKFMSFDVDVRDAEKISRVGLIRYHKPEKTFQFIHETFAEYFVADFIWFHLNKKNRDPSHDCRKAAEILIEVLYDRYDCCEFDVIQTFLDQILEAMKHSGSEAFCKSVAESLAEILKRTYRFGVLRRSLIASPVNLQNLLLSIVKYVEKDVLLQMLRSKSYEESNILLLAAYYGSNTFISTLCNIIKTCTDNPQEFFQDASDENVLSNAIFNKHGGVLTTLCSNLNSVLTNGEIKTMLQRNNDVGQNIIDMASISSTGEVFFELISLLPKYLSPYEIKSFMVSVDRWYQNFFHRSLARDTNESLKLKFDVIKSNFSIDEQKIFFYKPLNGPNIFHCAARNQNEKIFEAVFEFTRDVLSNDEIKLMLMENDSDESNVLHIIAEHGNEVVLVELNLLLRVHLSDDEIKSLLLEVNGKGQNCFRLAANNSKLNFQFFCEIIGHSIMIEDRNRLLRESVYEIDIISLACANITNEFVPIETIKYLLNRTIYFGLNVFQKIASQNDTDTWNKLISFAQSRFSADEMKSFLFCCDEDHRNCLHLAVLNNSQRNMNEAIFKTVKAVLSVADQEEFVRQKDSQNKNVFHHAATFLKCKSLYDGLSTILSKDEVKVMLKEKDSDGNNILCANSSSQFSDLESRDLIAFLQEILTKDDLKNLFFQVNCEGLNFFHCAVQFSSEFKIKSLSKIIKEILSRDDQKKFFGIKTPNVFQLAARNFNCEIFSTTHECLKGLLTEAEIKSLIQEKNSENKNILQMICQHFSHYGDEKWLHDFLEVLKAVCDSSELNHFLTSSDNQGNNCLLLAAQSKGELFLEEIFRFIRNKLSVDDQRDLFKKCDNDRKNIFKCSSSPPEKFSLVVRFAKEILSEAQIEELMIQMHQYNEIETNSNTS